MALDPALNRIHRCVAIMCNLSERPETTRVKDIYLLCQETMAHTAMGYPSVKNVVKMYLEPKTAKELNKFNRLKKIQYSPIFLNTIDDIVMLLLTHQTEKHDMCLEQRFADLVIKEDH